MSSSPRVQWKWRWRVVHDDVIFDQGVEDDHDDALRKGTEALRRAGDGAKGRVTGGPFDTATEGFVEEQIWVDLDIPYNVAITSS